jgi:tol-pal system protein YbgF
MTKQTLFVVFVGALMAAQAAMGAAPVVDPSTDRLDRLEQQVTNSAAESLPDQIRILQEELQALRGKVEVNEHEINQLKDRQRDLYSDLDSRINELKAGSPPAVPAAPAGVKPAASNAEQTLYNSAYDLMQDKQYDEAIAAFNQYLKTYPKGRFAPNAYYWMGETQLMGKELDAAKVAFQNILTQFPTHQKAADALLKLGYVYDAAGQKDKAIKTFNDVTQKYPGSSLARIAESRIQNIKQRG